LVSLQLLQGWIIAAATAAAALVSKLFFIHKMDCGPMPGVARRIAYCAGDRSFVSKQHSIVFNHWQGLTAAAG
jgi:hypothetical protein